VPLTKEERWLKDVPSFRSSLRLGGYVNLGRSLVVITLLLAGCFGQTSQPNLPVDPGMYVGTRDGATKLMGQIAEFKRTGSILVSSVTAGIKTQKQNIQLLGPHAQTIVSAQPVFYFVPARQEADTGVNAGDLILLRLEEKSQRRQFEIGAHGLWRASSGISLTHQIQLLRSEERPGVYMVMPARELEKGEYALYLSRGEGMAAYVYDFGVQGRVPEPTPIGLSPRDPAKSSAPPANIDGNAKASDLAAPPLSFADASVGVFCDGNPDVRHDGVALTALTPGGPAEQVGIKPGDFILAIDDHYLFTIRELKTEISRHQPGTKVKVRYRRHSTINEATIVVGKTD
jgi:PDZ domain